MRAKGKASTTHNQNSDVALLCKVLSAEWMLKKM
jgi:hypothetical protein